MNLLRLTLGLSMLCVGCYATTVQATPTKKPASTTMTKKGSPVTTTPSGLQYEDLRIGTGAAPKAGQIVAVNYVGTLPDGKEFDNSYKRGEPIKFHLGGGEVIKGWDEGLSTMKVGGKRKLTIPPSLGYGAAGAGGVIPPNATLIFEVELVSAN